MNRERDKVSGRTFEIQRLIGRSLRAVFDPKDIGERTIKIDCDVMIRPTAAPAPPPLPEVS